VLVVPACIASLELRNVVIGWKDTREARRALQDALPLLGEAKRVSIIGVGETDLEDQTRQQIDDVASYLARHRIDVATRMTVHAGGPASKQLLRVAQDEKADLIVAGGYGHWRLGEWIFGGMTQDLLAANASGLTSTVRFSVVMLNSPDRMLTGHSLLLSRRKELYRPLI
jgi:nucleotide-binding universal stress UspA family protein